MRHLCTIFALFCLSFAWLACSQEQSREESIGNSKGGACKGNPSFPAQQEAADGPAPRSPNSVLIVVRDLEGYFEDCGCSGTLVGGIPRIASLAPRGASATYLFVGRLLTPKISAHIPELQAAYSLQAPPLAAVAADVFALLPRVVWLPCAEELQQWEVWGIREQVLEMLEKWRIDGSFHWDDLPEAIGAEESGLSFGQDVFVPGPKANNRARDVLLLGCWKKDMHPLWSYNRTLGSLYDLAPESPFALHRFNDVLEHGRGSVVTAWTVNVTDDVSADLRLKEAADQRIVVTEHTGLKPRRSVEGSNPGDHFNECDTCHHMAVTRWRESRHFNAYRTLVERTRHNDVRCVNCHVEQVSPTIKGVRFVVHAPHQAVTCYSCHSAGPVTKTTCEACHTPITDPESRFLLRLKNICPGDIHTSGDNSRNCSRLAR